MQQGFLPLFPLEVVLFPRTPLPLHIFEDRYKEMIGEALRESAEFGVVLANQKGVVSTGCTASIEKVMERYPDGRMDILTRGRRRFEIQSLNEDREFLRGQVEFFDDDSSAAAPEQLRKRAVAAFEELVKISDQAQRVHPDWSDPQLSFQIAQAVPELNFRQVLLSMRSESDRMNHVAEFLEEYTVKQRQIAHVRSVAPRNGHGKMPPLTQ
ncbi:MAG: LON peptidase substrate-binding domain-containing protein [Bryobacteraceae bacterium]|nr:LON peptidase substrate-binding domain-containing protein [Bryobacteraceae bacterium]